MELPVSCLDCPERGHAGIHRLFVRVLVARVVATSEVSVAKGLAIIEAEGSELHGCSWRGAVSHGDSRSTDDGNGEDLFFQEKHRVPALLRRGAE